MFLSPIYRSISSHENLPLLPICEKGLRVASIAKLREGIDMPQTTAALYEVAASAILQRDTVSDAAVALLQATFFEAHADQQRVVTEKHLGAAAARVIVSGAGNHVYMYDAATEERLGTLEAGADVQCVALHNDRIAAGCENGTLKVWDSGV